MKDGIEEKLGDPIKLKQLSRKPTLHEIEKIQNVEDEAMIRAAAEEKQMKMVKDFRKKYVSKNIYIYPCNGCKRYGMLLHIETCMVCGTVNEFYEIDSQTDAKTSIPWSLNVEVFDAVMKIAEVLGAAQLPLEPVINVPVVIQEVYSDIRALEAPPLKPAEAKLKGNDVASNNQSAQQHHSNQEESKDGGGAAQAESVISVETETNWKCWNCNTINKMNAQCQKCKNTFNDCPYEDIQRWLVQVPMDDMNISHSSQRTAASDGLSAVRSQR